jgi:hypothetical protein
MADDLGDSHPKSLKQGGQLPEKSTAERLAGSIYADAGKTVTCKLFPEFNGYDHTISIYNGNNLLVATANGISSNTAPVSLTFTPSVGGWLSIKVKNTVTSNIAQRAWVNVAYTAPLVVNTRTTPAPLARGMQEESVKEEEIYQAVSKAASSFKIYPNPTNGTVHLQLPQHFVGTTINCMIISPDGSVLDRCNAAPDKIDEMLSAALQRQKPGVYMLIISNKTKSELLKLIKY